MVLLSRVDQQVLVQHRLTGQHPLITAAIRLGVSVVIDGDVSGEVNWQPRSAATALSNTADASWPPRHVSPRQCTTWTCSCHCPSGCGTTARAATA